MVWDATSHGVVAYLVDIRCLRTDHCRGRNRIIEHRTKARAIGLLHRNTIHHLVNLNNRERFWVRGGSDISAKQRLFCLGVGVAGLS